MWLAWFQKIRCQLQWKAQMYLHRKQADIQMPGKNPNKHGDSFTHVSAVPFYISFHSPLPHDRSVHTYFATMWTKNTFSLLILPDHQSSNSLI